MAMGSVAFGRKSRGNGGRLFLGMAPDLLAFGPFVAHKNRPFRLQCIFRIRRPKLQRHAQSESCGQSWLEQSGLVAEISVDPRRVGTSCPLRHSAARISFFPTLTLWPLSTPLSTVSAGSTGIDHSNYVLLILAYTLWFGLRYRHQTIGRATRYGRLAPMRLALIVGVVVLAR